MPPAPPTFSMMICWPSVSLMRAPRMRAMVSTGPPAAYGTTILIGRVGQLCACAGAIAVANTIPAAANTRIMAFLLEYGWTLIRLLSFGLVTSLHRNAGLHDHLLPAVHVLSQILREVLGRALLRRQDLEAELLQPFAHRRLLHHGVKRLVHPADQRVRCALREEEAVPNRGFDIRNALLAGGGKVGDDRDAPRRHHREALYRAGSRLRRAGLDGVAEIVD